MDIRGELRYRSLYWYNDGLKKAKIRDLTGALASLKKSIRFDKYNKDARNLLGLVYYGRGEVPRAMAVWIVSERLNPRENVATEYLKSCRESKNWLDTVDQAAKKYNQCLQYCRQGGEDLAIIQLKKIVSEQPDFLRAFQLLALLYLHTSQYAKARQVLRTAQRLDTTDPVTLGYIYELNRMHKKRTSGQKDVKGQQTVSYKLGNETIIKPVETKDPEKGMAFTIVNIVIGLVIGAAVMWFLIMPAVNESQTREKNESIVEASNQIASQKAEINALEKELESYRTKNDEAQTAKETAESTKSSYEALMDIQTQYQSGAKSNENLADELLAINLDSLGELGKEQHTTLANSIYPSACSRLYNRGSANFDVENYEAAIENLLKVVRMDEYYDSGNAMYLLAQAYEKSGDTENAKNYYQKVSEQHSGTTLGNDAQEALESLNAASAGKNGQ